MYRACIFDLDGTLASTLNSIAYFANSALERCGYPRIQNEKYRYLVGNGADKLMNNMLTAVCGAQGYPQSEVQKIRSIYDALYERNPTYAVENYDGVHEMLETLKKTGAKLAVLSNKPDNCAKAVAHALFGDGIFDLVYGQRAGVARKPSPEGALVIAKELEIPPQECLYIGDTNTDMKTGAAAGMDTVGVLWGFRDEQELRDNHAKYIVERPEQIYEIVACSMR